MIDISIEELRQRVSNIYEGVAVLFKRARQITDEQKLQREMEAETAQDFEINDNEEYDDVEIDREALQKEYKKYPKPTTQAIEEMLEDKIKFKYINPEENEEEQ